MLPMLRSPVLDMFEGKVVVALAFDLDFCFFVLLAAVFGPEAAASFSDCSRSADTVP